VVEAGVLDGPFPAKILRGVGDAAPYVCLNIFIL